MKNKETKERFILEFPEKDRKIRFSVFENSSKMEDRLNKDIFEFTIGEFEELIKILSTKYSHNINHPFSMIAVGSFLKHYFLYIKSLKKKVLKMNEDSKEIEVSLKIKLKSSPKNDEETVRFLVKDILKKSEYELDGIEVCLGDQKGMNNPHARLKDIDVIQIRKLYDNGFLIKDIAKQFNTSEQNVCRIGLRQRWKHIPECK